MKFFLLILYMAFFYACNLPISEIELKTGDLLFTGMHSTDASSDLSLAIDGVTQTGLNTHYTHIGIVEEVNGETWVIHAEPEKGVCKEILDDFIEGRGDARVYRLTENLYSAIPAAIEMANLLIGEPYDFSYIMQSSGYYCSGMIYSIFERYGVFELEPMTFVDPQTNEFHPVWVDHYNDLGIDIPEGLPGCNPNGMAASESVIFLGVYDK